MENGARTFVDLLNYQLFVLGEANITPLTVLYLVLLTIGLIYLSRKAVDILVKYLLARTSLGIGARQAIGTIVRYIVLFVGFIIILQTVGIDLTTLNVLAGAVGIGIGFGLQNIANNFISGLIVLLERPIQAGDRIEVGKVVGQVVAVGPRATRIKTNDNITIIVPNSKLISENVVNWSYKNNIIRIRVPVLVPPGTDIGLARDIMLEAAREHPDVAEKPGPRVNLISYDEDGIEFELRVWSSSSLHKPAALRSDLNYAIFGELEAKGIKLWTDEPKKATKPRRRVERATADNEEAEIAEAEAANMNGRAK